MSATLDKIIEEFRSLSPEEQQQLLERLGRENRSSEQVRRDIVRSIRGKYSHLPTSSEDFIALKREETMREDSKLGDAR